jgi:hypothetical protein
VAIEGQLERLAFVYVVQVAGDKAVEVLYPPGGAARRMRPGARVRIPAGTGWLITTRRGKLRVIAAAKPLSAGELAAIVEGRGDAARGPAGA